MNAAPVRGARWRRLLPAAALIVLAAACAPRLQPPGPLGLAEDAPAAPFASALPLEAAGMVVPGPGRIDGDSLVMPDGTVLPLRIWRPDGNPRAVVLALHGFNDHGRAFDQPGAAWAGQGLQVYAYDQRGFGAAPHRGIWPGWERMAADLWSAAAAVKAAHPELPLFVVGESMGSAVVLSAFAAPIRDARVGAGAPELAGAILSAPAVWGRQTMPPVYRWGLWLVAHTLPWHPVSGSGLQRRASDNDAALRRLWNDPLTIRYTRSDSVWGLVNLMDAALASADRIDVPVLTLYGENDQIVPAAPVMRLRKLLPADAEHRLYADGWHLLFRDLGAEQVWGEAAAWMLAHAPANRAVAPAPPPQG